MPLHQRLARKTGQILQRLSQVSSPAIRVTRFAAPHACVVTAPLLYDR